jgi:hypothetical protein
MSPKGKTLKTFKLNFFFCWLWKALLLHESLRWEVFKDLQNWHFLCAMLFASEYICVLKTRAFQRPRNHILILNESECLWSSFMSPKGKTLKIFKLHVFFCWLWKALLLHESLRREVFKDLQNWHFLCAMLFASEYICVLKTRAFQRPRNHILILNESECLWSSFMSPKGKTLKIFKLHFFLLVMGSFVVTWRL